jgi:acetyl esterase/lipase
MISGNAQADAIFLSRLAQQLNALVISVEYRLAPEHPFPAALDDCYIAFKWLHDEAPTLGVDPARIAIGGSSAGGGLCAALAQRAHDADEVKPAFQILICPMLDDRTTLKTSHGGRGELLWRPTENLMAWTAYLGQRPTQLEDRQYAVPARRENLSGLPPAWIGVGTLDLFYEEDVRYAERLRAAGVPCEVDVVEGAYHGFHGAAKNAPESVAFLNRMIDALRNALQPRDLTGSA